MSKRRVLALLLALSLVVSGNGMTVLAAEQGADMPVLASQEVLPETVPEEQENITGSMDSESAIEDKSEETEPSTEGEASTEVNETEDKTEEGEAPEISDEDVGDQTGDQSSTEEDGNGEQEEVPGVEEQEPEPVIDMQEPTVSGNEAEETEEPETEKPEENTFQVQPYVSRMVTFTDDTGMRVTYDANASQQYSYVVENGVLTGVNQKEVQVDISGNTIEVEKPVVFEGNVELRQPETGEQYTSIAPGVFGGNTKITYVKLPAGLTSVAAESFKGCTGLKGVYLPPTVTEIGASAFEACTAMTQISVPKVVTSIGDSAFKGDTRLHLIYIKDGGSSDLETIGAHAFEGCVVLAQFCLDSCFEIPDKVTFIGTEAFKGCKAVTAIDFSNAKIQEMGASAFEGCTGLVDLTIGENLELIPERAFADCTALVSITFPMFGKLVTIGEYAFRGCYSLKQLVLPQRVVAVKNYAFQDCTKLTRVEIEYDNISLGSYAFPVGVAKGLIIIAKPGSKGDDYAAINGVQADAEGLYTYKVEDIDGSVVPGGKFAGGTIWVCGEGESNEDKNINTLNKGKGIKSGEKCYIYYRQTDAQRGDSAKPDTGYKFIAESLRCNGAIIQKVGGKYCFTMPEGGAVITAEFRANTLDRIKGKSVTVEFSAGELLQNGEQDGWGYLGVELKVGQTTQMYVLDEDGETIPASKLKLTSRKTSIATVDKNGKITAAGTEAATTQIDIEVKGGDSEVITFSRTVSVRASEAKSITIKASDIQMNRVDMEEKADGIWVASINKNAVKADDMKFKLNAKVSDGIDDIGKKLTWSSSDTSVATLEKKTTEPKDLVNEVTVKKGCEGEATITVTANNDVGSEKEKVTQKFVIRVYQKGYKLTASSVTVNPYLPEGGSIELISTGLAKDFPDETTIQIYPEKTMGTTEFTAVFDKDASRENCKKFYIRPIAKTIEKGTYKVRIAVNGETNELLPLTIKVNRTAPTPTIKFNSKKVKFNLFYKNGGTDAKGNPTVVTTEITKLDGAKIQKVELKPLTQSADDVLFTDNFEIDSELSDFAAGKVIIKRTKESLKYRTDKKPAVKGQLVIYYAGYEDEAAKKMTVTMPTCTTAPSYALRETGATYHEGCGTTEELLEIYDKKSKTKEKVNLTGYSVTEEQNEIRRDVPEIKNGAIAIKFTPMKGKLKLVLRNEDWDSDKNGNPRTLSFTFKVSMSDKKPAVKTNRSSINYPEVVNFTLTANQKGLKIGETQKFEPKSEGTEINKFQITYENGEGLVSVKPGERVKKGTYKFTCKPQVEGWSDLNMVTLTVKVVDTVKFGKGSLQLNLEAFKHNSTMTGGEDESNYNDYRETAEIPFTVKGLPVGYKLADVGTDVDSTKLECSAGASIRDCFEFHVTEGNTDEKTENKLSVSLNKGSVSAGTYTFNMSLAYRKDEASTIYTTPASIKVKVYSSNGIGIKVTAKGKINLVNREGEATDKNGIIYTPTLQKLAGEITDVKIYDASTLDKESEYFDIELITEGKNKGKFFVTPKKTAVQTEEGALENTYATLENNKKYKVCIWAEVKGYRGTADKKNGVITNPIDIKTLQVLPKVVTDKSTLDVFLSTKDYDASFIVSPKQNSVGTIEEVYFGEKDEMARENFELHTIPREDGSQKVIVHLKDGGEYKKGSTNNVKMYVKYKGQGMNTKTDATSFTMKIKVN